MKQNRPVRIVKNGQRLTEAGAVAAKPTGSPGLQPTERELKRAVSSWVREHQQRSDEYRRTIAKMFRENTLLASRKPSLA